MHIMKNSRLKLRARGFTLAEVLITMGILGFLASLTVPVIMMKKAKKIESQKTPHGLVECYWTFDNYYPNEGKDIPEGSGRKLIQFKIDSETNPNGETTVISDVDDNSFLDDYCTAEIPEGAKFYKITIVGAGGDGAVVDEPGGEVVEENYDLEQSEITTETGQRGSVSIDSNFQASLRNAPWWVRRYWNEQWDAGKREVYEQEHGGAYPPLIQYVLTHPLGRGGYGLCQTKTNPDTGLLTYEGAAGGASGYGWRVTLWDVRLLKDKDISYTINKDVTRIDFGNDIYAKLTPTKQGGDATSIGESGQDGNSDIEEWPLAQHFEQNLSDSLATSIDADKGAGGVNEGAESCADGSGNLKTSYRKEPESAKAGSITARILQTYKNGATPTVLGEGANATIIYAKNSPALKLTYGTAGEAAIPTTRIFTKLPATKLLLAPAKYACNDINSGSCSNPTASIIYTGENLEDIMHSDFNQAPLTEVLNLAKEQNSAITEDVLKHIFLTSKSGQNGQQIINENFLLTDQETGNEGINSFIPFPAVLKDKVAGKIPYIPPVDGTFAKKSSYNGYVKNDNSGMYTPGKSGMGRFPLLDPFSYAINYYINGIKVNHHVGGEDKKLFGDGSGYGDWDMFKHDEYCARFDSNTSNTDPGKEDYWVTDDNELQYFCRQQRGNGGAIIISW